MKTSKKSFYLKNIFISGKFYYALANASNSIIIVYLFNQWRNDKHESETFNNKFDHWQQLNNFIGNIKFHSLAIIYMFALLQQLLIQFSALTDVWSSEWYRLNLREKKIFLIIMAQLQANAGKHAYGLVEFNMESLLKVNIYLYVNMYYILNSICWYVFLFIFLFLYTDTKSDL